MVLRADSGFVREALMAWCEVLRQAKLRPPPNRVQIPLKSAIKT